MNKSEARLHYRRIRNKLLEAEIQEKSLQISSNCLQFFDWKNFRYVHTFLPINHLKEINTNIIINALRKNFAHLIITVPKIDISSSTLVSAKLDRETELFINHIKIPEPIDSFLIDAELIDIVFIPLLCADAQGHRVGYGKGFYDKFLATCKPNIVKVGLSFFPPIQKISDIGAHDIALDYCVTPERIYNFLKV